MATVLITGTNSGIGKALSEAFLQRGDRVYGVSKSEEPALRHARFDYLSLDLEALEQIEGKVSRFVANVERFDLVVLNAGVLGEIAPMKRLSIADAERVMRINVWANKVILDTLVALKIPIGQVVAISSGAAVNGSKGWGAYSISKAALNMLLKLYSREMPQTHLTALAPGVIDTPMVRHILNEVDEEAFPSVSRLKNGPILSPEEAAERLLKAFEEVKKYESGSFLDVRKM